MDQEIDRGTDKGEQRLMVFVLLEQKRWVWEWQGERALSELPQLTESFSTILPLDRADN